MNAKYDAILLVSFGGPESRDDVMPFLENVLRGKNVPRERMLAVAEHYYHFGGVSPINEQNRNLIAALRSELASHGPQLPVYWGNRNWHPLLADTLAQMKTDGIRRALALMTSAFSSYSGCRQYREDIDLARAAVGDGAPEFDKLRVFFNHPGFVEPMIERVRDALASLAVTDHARVQLVFTAHSIPMAMANGCSYEIQLRESCRLVAAAFPDIPWTLTYQSRSGPPSQPWLEPDVGDHVAQLAEHKSCDGVVVIPIGFVSDHLEVLFDLDTELRDRCDSLGMKMSRAATVGTHPRFVSMLRELIEERVAGAPRLAVGLMEASHDVCPVDCCLSGRPPSTSRPNTH